VGVVTEHKIAGLLVIDPDGTQCIRSDLEKLVRGIARIYATSATYADHILSMVRTPEILDAISKARLAS
jgi:hypothetical protein